MKLLEIKNLSKRFDDKEVLKDVNLSVKVTLAGKDVSLYLFIRTDNRKC